jgi:HPt (histidine-containing phosphotransfer) domain-containing protein
VSRAADDEVERALAELRAEYATTLAARIETVRTAATTALATRDAEALELATREAHRLRGSAGSYGFPEISEAAGAVEEAFVRARDGDVGACGAAIAALDAAAARLR